MGIMENKMETTIMGYIGLYRGILICIYIYIYLYMIFPWALPFVNHLEAIYTWLLNSYMHELEVTCGGVIW